MSTETTIKNETASGSVPGKLTPRIHVSVSPHARSGGRRHPQRERRVAAEHLRAGECAGERKAQRAVHDLPRPFLAFQQLDPLHSLSPPVLL